MSNKMFRGGLLDRPVQQFRAPAKSHGEYVGDWFLSHPGRKPELVLTQYPADCTADVIAETIYRRGMGNPVGADYVVFMIAEAFKSLVATNTTEWSSFGTLIAREGVNVTPLSVLDVKMIHPENVVGLPDAATTRTVTPLALLYLVFAPLRLDTNYAEYKDALVTRMTAAMGTMRLPPNLSPATFATGYANLRNNNNYLKLTSALDMFLNRFPGNDHAKLRIGTIVSRFRDCSGLKTLVYFTSIMGVGDEDILGWVWNKDVARDVERVMDYRSAPDDEFGYGPYFSFMKFGSKSATSMVMNPFLHIYVHTIRIVMGHQRSINAIMPSEVPYHNVMRTAMAIGYAMTGPGNVAQEFGEAGKVMVDIHNYGGPGNDETGIAEGGALDVALAEEERPPIGANYEDWLHFYGRNADRMIFERHTFEAARLINNRQHVYRERSVGLCLATFAAAIVQQAN